MIDPHANLPHAVLKSRLLDAERMLAKAERLHERGRILALTQQISRITLRMLEIETAGPGQGRAA